MSNTLAHVLAHGLDRAPAAIESTSGERLDPAAIRSMADRLRKPYKHVVCTRTNPSWLRLATGRQTWLLSSGSGWPEPSPLPSMCLPRAPHSMRCETRPQPGYS